jgi:hypothetical protein
MTSGWLAALLRRCAAGDDEEIVVQMLVERAQSRLDAQLHVRQWLDLKALGLLGADAAAAGVLIAVHDAVNRFWWFDATGLALAGLLLLVAVWPRTLDGGPSLREFYETFGSAAAVDVGRQMLAELLEAIETNDRVIRATNPRCSSSSASS